MSERTVSGRRGQPSSSDTGQSLGKDALADRLSDLARSLEHEHDVDQTLKAIVASAVETVPGADEASISSIRARHEVRTLASTSELATNVDRVQYESDQGPCLDALYRQRTVRLADLGDEERWPDFTTRARALGVNSMLAFQLYVDGDDLGALNLFSREVNAFDDESEHVGLLFASHAAVAMSGAQTQHHLREAINTREVIGKATGILMERFKITDTQAFRLLVQASQLTNRKLRDIADELASTGELASR